MSLNLLNQGIPKSTINQTIETMKSFTNFDKNTHKLKIYKVAKVNKSWKKTTQYIECFISIKHNSEKIKLLNSKKNIIDLKINTPPFIYINESGEIEFYNGKNKFINLRNEDVVEMPFIIQKKDHEILKKKFSQKK